MNAAKMNEISSMHKIESLLDTYVFAYDDYRNSQTCYSQTYKQQEEAMYDARYALLNFITENLLEKS